MLDPLEEVAAPALLPLLRGCSRRGCQRLVPAGSGRYCRPCATEAMQRWRERHREALTERERARAWTEDQKAVRKARAYLAVYVKRGKLQRGRCEVCRDPEVQAVWTDPSRPLEVRWLCQEHRHVPATERRRDEWTQRLARARAQLALLPPARRAEIEDRAARGVARVVLDREAPLYAINLVRLVEAAAPAYARAEL